MTFLIGGVAVALAWIALAYCMEREVDLTRARMAQDFELMEGIDPP
jgi:hypothetical protein